MIFQKAPRPGGRRGGRDDVGERAATLLAVDQGREPKTRDDPSAPPIQQDSKARLASGSPPDPPTLLASSCGALLWGPTTARLSSTPILEAIPRPTHSVLAEGNPTTAPGMAASVRSLASEASSLDEFPSGSQEEAHRSRVSGMSTSISLRLGQSLAERRYNPRQPSASPPLSPTHHQQRTLCQARLSFASISLSVLQGEGHHSLPQSEAMELPEPSREGNKGSPQPPGPVPVARLGLRQHPGERLGAAMNEAFSRLKDGTEHLGSLRLRLPMFRLPFFDETDADAAESALNHVYAGTMARTLSQVVCHPVDTVKTRMQIKDPTKKLRKWRRKISKKAFELGPLDIDNWFFKGPGDLFRGVWGAVLGTIPNAMLYFVAYESTKKRLEKLLPAGVVHVASASVGTFAASIVRVPADTVKHRVQAYMHKNVFEACQVIIQTEGIAGLYRGFWPTLMRDIPEIAIQFSVYENLRAFVTEKRKVEKLTTPEHLMLGACAGAIAATCTIPLDLVKTRQQCGTSEAIHRIVASVIAESGPMGLIAGLGPRAFHVSLMSAVFFGLFEYCKAVMKPNRLPNDKLTLPKIFNKRRDHIWKRQFVYTE